MSIERTHCNESQKNPNLKNWQYNHKSSPPLSYKQTVLEDYPLNLTKHDIKETSSELGKIWK